MSTFISVADSKKILKLYYQQEVSEEFLDCASIQLSNLFETLTGIKINGPIRIIWDSNDPFTYEKGSTSSIPAKISLKYGSNKVKIVWKSGSGKLYDISDPNIDCNDIQFWFEGLDPVRCYRLMYPQWSLFTFPELYVEMFNRNNEKKISVEFIICADKQLTQLFEDIVGININKNVSLNIQDSHSFSYKKDTISQLACTMYINHNWNNNVFILWKSKSGRMYDVEDRDVDCNDIEFWFEGLDPLLYHQQLFPKVSLPFKLKDLTYRLTINRLNMNCIFEMQVKKEKLKAGDEIFKRIDQFIDDFNTESEKDHRKSGVVHNWKRNMQENKLIYEIDTGFSGFTFLKKFLQFLSKLDCFENLRIE